MAVDTYAVYTNNVPGAAFRGFGGPQGHFAAESQMDKLAEALGIDPVELRLKNVLTDEKLLTVGTPIPGGVGLTETIITAAKAAGWTQDAAGTGRSRCGQPIADSGFGRTQSEIRNPRSAASASPPASRTSASASATRRTATRGSSCAAAEIEEAIVYFAGADCGQGNHTVIAQMAAEVAGVPFERVRMVASDTARMGDSGSASASRLTYMTRQRGPRRGREGAGRLEERGSPAVGEYVYLAPKTTPTRSRYRLWQAQLRLRLRRAGGRGGGGYRDRRGAGRALRQRRRRGQGHQSAAGDRPDRGRGGAGAGLRAPGGLQTARGRVLTDKLSTYLIPTVLDVPDRMDAIIVEVPDPNGPFGARGMGEMPYLPAAAAVAAAVHDATGVRFDAFPLTPERVWRGCEKRRHTRRLRDSAVEGISTRRKSLCSKTWC